MDTGKATANYAKQVSFEEAATVFGDPDALDGPDLVILRRSHDSCEWAAP